MKVRFILFLCLITALLLTGCSYQKPETYSVQEVAVDSITTVCQTDCRLSDVRVTANSENCTAVYEYTGVEKEQGVNDAKTYYDYLKNHKNCYQIEDFSEDTGSYTAYIASTDDVVTGFTLKVAFTKDSYTVTMTDNLILDDIPAK